MKLEIKYSKIRHARARVSDDGTLVLSIPLKLKNNKKFEQDFLEKAKKLLEKKDKNKFNKIEIISGNTMKLWGEDVDIMDKKYLLEQFRNKIEPLIKFHCAKLGVGYGKISMKYLKSKWGSCSSSNNLSFNLNLVHLDPIFAYYVVVHEVCHIVQKNHSKKFRNLVAYYFPNYKEVKAEMRKFVIK